jgi:uncharacterized protein
VRTAVARGGLLALALAAAWTPAAAAHVTVQPAASRPADLQLYRVLVPNEREDADTTGVDLKLPAGVDFVLIDDQPGWTARIVRAGGQPSQLIWSGGSVKPGSYAELRFIARNPVKTGTVEFKTLQRYSDGEIVRWIGASDSENPAPRVRVAEDAIPQDVVSVHGEQVPAGAPGGPRPAAPARPAAAATDGGGRDTVTLVLAIVAVVLALGALAAALRGRSGRVA